MREAGKARNQRSETIFNYPFSPPPPPEADMAGKNFPLKSYV
jgi:hypothetical protein